jgi:hypothetical protein
MDLTNDQQEAIRSLERHVQDNVRVVMQLKAGEKPADEKRSAFLEECERCLQTCTELKVPDTQTFEVTEYEDYTTLKFSIKEFRSEIGVWNKSPKKSGGEKKNSNLTEDQREALEALKNSIEGQLHTILELRNGQKVSESKVGLLVELTAKAIEVCKNANVEGSAAFEVTNWADPDKSKVQFTVSVVEKELPKWKKARK